MKNRRDISNDSRRDYRVINLRYEYRGYTGNERYAIITDLSEKELNEIYETEIAAYRPFLILTCEMGRAMYEYDLNEAKHKRRIARTEEYCCFTSLDEHKHSEFWSLDEQHQRDEEEFYEDLSRWIKESIDIGLCSLSTLQRKYLIEN